MAFHSLIATGCTRAADPDLDATYQSIHTEFVRGNLDGGQTRAAQARKEATSLTSDGQTHWSLKFLLLEAEIALARDEEQQVLSLLNGGVSFPSTGDLAIKRELLCSRAHYHLGQRQESDQELSEARRLAESAHSALIGDVLRAEALVERDAGHLDQALDKFSSSLAAARERPDQWLEVTDLVDLGYVNLQRGHYDQALVHSQQAFALAENLQARAQMRRAIGNVGWSYFNLGDFENALTRFQTAERLAKELGMTSSRVLWLQDAGLAAYQLGDLDEARAYDEEALQTAAVLPPADEADQIANIEANLALMLLSQGQYDDARTHSDRSARAAGNSKDGNVTGYAALLQGMVATRQARYEDAQRALTAALKLDVSAEIRGDVENALADLYARQHQRSQAEQWYRRSIQTFEQNRSSIRDESLRLSSFAAHGESAYRSYADFLMTSDRSLEALRLLDHSRSRTLEEGLGATRDETADSQKDIVEPTAVARRFSATILFYSLGADKSYLWTITSQQTHVFSLPGEKEIRALVNDYQRAIRKSSDPLQAADSAGSALYDMLVKPAASMIPAGSRVFLIPDGILYSLNFETLLEPADRGHRYWIEDATVTTVSSLRILARSAIAANGTATRDLLLMGDPTPAGKEFDALPNASAEIERIEGHFSRDEQTLLSQVRAVPSAYVSSNPEQFRYIHFVAHGTASRTSPLDSAIVLSPTPQHPDDFKLYAREIVRHPLHARLVTISACYGSGLRTYAGEGMVGLAWAFLRAGSHHVIGALWEADDAATPLLMDRLYAELSAGRPTDEALRTAKLALIRSGGVYRKPYYWAAFQLYAGA